MLLALRRPLRSLREGLLLPGGPVREDVELAPVALEAASTAGPQIIVVRQAWREYALAAGLLVAVLLPSTTIAAVVLGEWHSRPSQRGWLILGFGFYIATAIRTMWEVFVRVCERILYLRVELRRFACPTLFEAVTDALAKESERLGLTCSWDQEATQEHDKLTGDILVKLRFWSSRPRTMDVCVTIARDPQERNSAPEQLHVKVQFSPGADVVCGRDSRVERQEMLVLSIRTTSERALADKALLTRWFEACYKTYVKPSSGIVNVFALQESSTEWMPEWKFERVKPCKSASGTGQSFFLERGSLDKVLADARLWSNTALRVYMITGPPGVGKSEFTIWLAGQLGVPVYRLCLSSPRLTDDRLAQLLSQSAVTHSSVLVQVDEFQGTLQRWVDSAPAGTTSGVTPGGFCECLQGSTAMSRGIVVLTGTNEIVAEHVKGRLPAVFRRIHCVAELSWMLERDVRCYFRQFLIRFVPECSTEEWCQWEQAFLSEGGPWAGKRPVSVDMLKQYLMHQITESSCLGIGDFAPRSSATGAGTGEFHVHPDRHADFFSLVCDPEKAEAFLNSYAPVHQVLHVGPQA